MIGVRKRKKHEGAAASANGYLTTSETTKDNKLNIRWFLTSSRRSLTGRAFALILMLSLMAGITQVYQNFADGDNRKATTISEYVMAETATKKTTDLEQQQRALATETDFGFGGSVHEAYRLGDVFLLWHLHQYEISFDELVRRYQKSYPNTLAHQYLLECGDKKYGHRNMTALLRVMDRRQPERMAQPDELIVHLRLGDVMTKSCCTDLTKTIEQLWWDEEGFVNPDGETKSNYNRKEYTTLLQRLPRDYQTRFRKCVIVGAAFVNNKSQNHRNLEYKELVANFFHETVGCEVEIYKNDNPDETLLFMGSSHYMINGMGGFAQLSAASVTARRGLGHAIYDNFNAHVAGWDDTRLSSSEKELFDRHYIDWSKVTYPGAPTLVEMDEYVDQQLRKSALYNFWNDTNVNVKPDCGAVKCFFRSITNLKIGYLVTKERRLQKMARGHYMARKLQKKFDARHLYVGAPQYATLTSDLANHFHDMQVENEKFSVNKNADELSLFRRMEPNATKRVVVQRVLVAPADSLFIGSCWDNYDLTIALMDDFRPKIKDLDAFGKRFEAELDSVGHALKKYPELLYDFQGMVDAEGNFYYTDMDGHVGHEIRRSRHKGEIEKRMFNLRKILFLLMRPQSSGKDFEYKGLRKVDECVMS